jgi:hypothetical protein
VLRGVQSCAARPIGAMLRGAKRVALCRRGAVGWALGVRRASRRRAGEPSVSDLHETCAMVSMRGLQQHIPDWFYLRCR